MDFDTSWEALSKPGLSDHYFQFEKQPYLKTGSLQFEFDNALLLAELCRMIYRNDEVVHCGKHTISFISTILKQANIEWIDCFKNDELGTYSWLLKTQALDIKRQTKQACLILVFRGTSGFDNWKLNTKALHTSHEFQGSVHRGFYDAYRSIEEQILNSDDIKKLPLFLTGHSLGGAMATLSMASLLKAKRNVEACYTYGSPKVGDDEFAKQFRNKNIYRIINRNDVVSILPFDFLNTHYIHVGESHYFSETQHHQNKSDKEIETLQNEELPGIHKVKSIDGFLDMIRSLDTDIPSFLSDHAPVNYLARLIKNN